MIYKLILITILSNGDVYATDYGNYNNIAECFDQRDNLLVEEQAYDGYFPVGKQAICLSFEKK